MESPELERTAVDSCCMARMARNRLVKTRCTICRIGMVDRRRTRVVERPCGLDVSGVNALSVPEFLSHELGNDSRETADFGW